MIICTLMGHNMGHHGNICENHWVGNHGTQLWEIIGELGGKSCDNSSGEEHLDIPRQ